MSKTKKSKEVEQPALEVDDPQEKHEGRVDFTKADRVKPAKQQSQQKPLYKWLAKDRIELDGIWYIVISNIESDLWVLAPEVPGYHFHTYEEISPVYRVIPRDQMRDARANSRLVRN